MKKITIISGVIAFTLIVFMVYLLFFQQTPEEKEKQKVKELVDDSIELLYKMDVSQEEVKEYAKDYKVATEFINFSNRNYMNISAADDVEFEKLNIPKKKELVRYFDEQMADLLEISKKNTSYKIKSIDKDNADSNKYHVELEIHPFDLNAYYAYNAYFVELFISGASIKDTYKEWEDIRLRFIKDVYIAKAHSVNILKNYYLDDFMLNEVTNYTVDAEKTKNGWKIDNLNNLQFAFNGGYAKKYIDGNSMIDVTEINKSRVLEIWNEALDKGLMNEKNLRDTSMLLNK